MYRVVITGMGVVSPLGQDLASLLTAVEAGQSAVRRMEGWERYQGLRSLVAAPAELQGADRIPRPYRRTMSRMSIHAFQATRQALQAAHLAEEQSAAEGVGCIIGSTMGSATAINESFELMLPQHDLSNLPAGLFFRSLPHTAVMNVAQALGITGLVLAPAAACASGLQAIGLGYELIRTGRQSVLLCGGAEELHPTVTGSFDILMATSTRYNQTPEKTPRPFDRDRDGLVCGEGSGVVLVEEYGRARARGAPLVAEVIGFATCSSGDHLSQSNAVAMARVMRAALADAQLSTQQVDYVNAHATGTPQGDAAEAEAIRQVFPHGVPVSSFKGYLGHTLAASGAIELILTLAGIPRGILYATRNLDVVAPECEGLQHIRQNRRLPSNRPYVVLKNSFAFGGINAALVCRCPVAESAP